MSISTAGSGPAPGFAGHAGDVLAGLAGVPGVRSADLDAEGLLTLELEDGVDEVQVATSVSRLLERFGLGVDPGEVQMVEAIGAGGVMAPAELLPAAIEVRGMSVVSTGRRVHVTVTLSRGGRECVGEATGTTSTSGAHRAVAEATLHALEELTDDAVIGRVERLDVAAHASVDLVLDLDGDEVEVSGGSPVETDERQAIVRAVLLAVAPHLP